MPKTLTAKDYEAATFSGLFIWSEYGCLEESVADVLVGGVEKVKVRVYLDKTGPPNGWRHYIEVLAVDPDTGEANPTEVLYKTQVHDSDETTAIEAKELREKHEHRNQNRKSTKSTAFTKPLTR